MCLKSFLGLTIFEDAGLGKTSVSQFKKSPNQNISDARGYQATIFPTRNALSPKAIHHPNGDEFVIQIRSFARLRSLSAFLKSLPTSSAKVARFLIPF